MSETALLDSEFLDPIPQRPEAHAEQLRRRRLVVARLLQRLDDGVALDFLEVLSKGCIAGCGGRGWGQWRRGTRRGAQFDVIGGDHAARAKGERALENILELAYVAGEGIRL